MFRFYYNFSYKKSMVINGIIIQKKNYGRKKQGKTISKYLTDEGKKIEIVFID